MLFDWHNFYPKIFPQRVAVCKSNKSRQKQAKQPKQRVNQTSKSTKARSKCTFAMSWKSQSNPLKKYPLLEGADSHNGMMRRNCITNFFHWDNIFQVCHPRRWRFRPNSGFLLFAHLVEWNQNVVVSGVRSFCSSHLRIVSITARLPSDRLPSNWISDFSRTGDWLWRWRSTNRKPNIIL